MTEQNFPPRIMWIDCAKAVAIIAVLVDHCNQLLYHNSLIASASYFSVTLFVLLSGYSMQLAVLRGKEITVVSQLKKVGAYFLQYALATSIGFILTNGGFDFVQVLIHILHFSLYGPYYFFLFFFQLMLIAPFLLSWCKFCNSRNITLLWQSATFVFLGYAASLSIRYTVILPIYGGGRFLFGGTYLLVYYIGMVLGTIKIPSKTGKIWGGGSYYLDRLVVSNA